MTNIHAGCILLARSGVLVRGHSGSGKSAVADYLVETWRADGSFATLISDDRTEIVRHKDRVIGRALPTIEGLCELRGFGIRNQPHCPAAVIRLIVDLVREENLSRMPEASELSAEIEGLTLPRQALPIGNLVWSGRLVAAALQRTDIGVQENYAPENRSFLPKSF